jgi:hypothetical protein
MNTQEIESSALVVTSEDSTVTHVAIFVDYKRRTLCGRTGRLLDRVYATAPTCLRCAQKVAK